MLCEVFNDYLDACGVPPMPDVYFWPPRQSDLVYEFLAENNQELLQDMLRLMFYESLTGLRDTQ